MTATVGLCQARLVAREHPGCWVTEKTMPNVYAAERLAAERDQGDRVFAWRAVGVYVQCRVR
jgi:hypothetical protein